MDSVVMCRGWYSGLDHMALNSLLSLVSCVQDGILGVGDASILHILALVLLHNLFIGSLIALAWLESFLKVVAPVYRRGCSLVPLETSWETGRVVIIGGQIIFQIGVMLMMRVIFWPFLWKIIHDQLKNLYICSQLSNSFVVIIQLLSQFSLFLLSHTSAATWRTLSNWWLYRNTFFDTWLLFLTLLFDGLIQISYFNGGIQRVRLRLSLPKLLIFKS